MIAALLSFYDEPPDDLVRCVTSLSRAGITHLVAVDGPYGAFPHAAAASHPAQHSAIRNACWSIGIGLTLHVPGVAWEGNEIAKRTFMHRLAYMVTGPEAWHLVIDADEVVDSAPGGLADQLMDFIPFEVAVVTCREQGGGDGLRRRLFLAQPLHLERRHCIYVADDGTILVDDGGEVGEQVAAYFLPELILNHRHGLRGQQRLDAKRSYYDELTEGGHLMCETGCGRQATQRIRTNYRVTDQQLLSDPLDVCQFCADVGRTRAAAAIRALGFNPDRMAH